MSAAVLARQLREMPKVELHCHLEGCVRPETFIDLARRHGVDLPSDEPAQVYAYHDMASFMEVFERLCAAVVTRDDVARITYEALVDAARGSNVVYREMFVNPTLHPTLTYPELLDGLTAGVHDARADTGIVARLIPSVYRAHSPAQAAAMARDVVSGPRDLVVGLGMDGDELAGPPAKFVDAYAIARDGGLHVTAHAGERFDAQETADCLDLLGCTRLDHGYALTRDPALAARVRAEGIHITYAWLSTTYNFHGPMSAHPVRLMRDAGLSMSMGSDDPAMGGTDLSGDYVAVADAVGFTLADFTAQNRAALEASWLTGPDRDLVRERLW